MPDIQFAEPPKEIPWFNTEGSDPLLPENRNLDIKSLIKIEDPYQTYDAVYFGQWGEVNQVVIQPNAFKESVTSNSLYTFLRFFTESSDGVYKFLGNDQNELFLNKVFIKDSPEQQEQVEILEPSQQLRDKYRNSYIGSPLHREIFSEYQLFDRFTPDNIDYASDYSTIIYKLFLRYEAGVKNYEFIDNELEGGLPNLVDAYTNISEDEYIDFGKGLNEPFTISFFYLHDKEKDQIQLDYERQKDFPLNANIGNSWHKGVVTINRFFNIKRYNKVAMHSCKVVSANEEDLEQINQVLESYNLDYASIQNKPIPIPESDLDVYFVYYFVTEQNLEDVLFYVNRRYFIGSNPYFHFFNPDTTRIDYFALPQNNVFNKELVYILLPNAFNDFFPEFEDVITQNPVSNYSIREVIDTKEVVDTTEVFKLEPTWITKNYALVYANNNYWGDSEPPADRGEKIILWKTKDEDFEDRLENYQQETPDQEEAFSSIGLLNHFYPENYPLSQIEITDTQTTSQTYTETKTEEENPNSKIDGGTVEIDQDFADELNANWNDYDPNRQQGDPLIEYVQAGDVLDLASMPQFAIDRIRDNLDTTTENITVDLIQSIDVDTVAKAETVPETQKKLDKIIWRYFIDEDTDINELVKEPMADSIRIKEIHQALEAQRYATYESTVETNDNGQPVQKPRVANIGYYIERMAHLLGINVLADGTAYLPKLINKVEIPEDGGVRDAPIPSPYLNNQWGFGKEDIPIFRFEDSLLGQEELDEFLDFSDAPTNDIGFEAMVYPIVTNKFVTDESTGEVSKIKAGGVALVHNIPQLWDVMMQDVDKGLGLQEAGAFSIRSPNDVNAPEDQPPQLCYYEGLHSLVAENAVMNSEISRRASKAEVVSMINQALLQELMAIMGLPIEAKSFKTKIGANSSGEIVEANLYHPAFANNAPRIYELWTLLMQNLAPLLGNNYRLDEETEKEIQNLTPEQLEEFIEQVKDDIQQNNG